MMTDKRGKLIYLNRTPQNLDQMERIDLEALRGMSRVKIAPRVGPLPIKFKDEIDDENNR
jgi:hypothetical protein